MGADERGTIARAAAVEEEANKEGGGGGGARGGKSVSILEGRG